MEKAPPKARLFVALDLPDDARQELVRWREGVLGRDPSLRFVAPESLHVTLVFLGHLDEALIPAVAAATETAVGTGRVAPLLTAAGVKPIPPRRPRLIALDLVDEQGAATALQARLATALASLGVYEPEPRPFWPHVTLARVRRGERAARLNELPAPPSSPWRVRSVTLYRSYVSRVGARYEALTSLSLQKKA